MCSRAIIPQRDTVRYLLSLSTPSLSHSRAEKRTLSAGCSLTAPWRRCGPLSLSPPSSLARARRRVRRCRPSRWILLPRTSFLDWDIVPGDRVHISSCAQSSIPRPGCPSGLASRFGSRTHRDLTRFLSLQYECDSGAFLDRGIRSANMAGMPPAPGAFASPPFLPPSGLTLRPPPSSLPVHASLAPSAHDSAHVARRSTCSRAVGMLAFLGRPPPPSASSSLASMAQLRPGSGGPERHARAGRRRDRRLRPF